MSILLSEGKTLISFWKAYTGIITQIMHDSVSHIIISPQTHWTLTADPALCQVLFICNISFQSCNFPVTDVNTATVSTWQVTTWRQIYTTTKGQMGDPSQMNRLRTRDSWHWPTDSILFSWIGIQPFPNSGRCRENTGRHLGLWVWEKTFSETAIWQKSTPDVLAWPEEDQ